MTTDFTPEFRALLRKLKLTPVLSTLPERLELARQQKMPHLDFLELLLSDEVDRRSHLTLKRRAQRGHLDPLMVLENWDPTAEVTFDHELWAELTSLRFLASKHNVLVLGPVGVGKTFMANALGHIACRHGKTALCVRADRMLKELKASRLDGTYERELRRLVAVDLLIVDDFGIERLDETESRDVYDVILERHRSGSTIVTSNREPAEWLALLSDPIRAQSAIDRLLNSAYELIVEGESYRKRQKPRWP